MPQIFLNNFQSQFIADVRAAPQSNNPATELDYGILRVSDGAAGTLLNPPAGDWYVLTAFKRSGSLESDYEIMRVTAVDNSVVGECRLTVQRGQEGMAPQAYARGDLLECRLTAGGMREHVQTTDSRMSNSRAPSGPAGGVLSGQYPNPGFANPMATAADLVGKVDKVAGKGLSANDFTNAQAAKLEGVAEQATKNATDAQLRDRASHTGTQPIATVAGLQPALDGKVSSVNGQSGTVTLDFVGPPGAAFDKSALMANAPVNKLSCYNSITGAGADWPTADPVAWWNVFTYGGSGTRATQIAQQVFQASGTDPGVLFSRAKHDGNWSPWRNSVQNETSFFTRPNKIPNAGFALGLDGWEMYSDTNRWDWSVQDVAQGLRAAMLFNVQGTVALAISKLPVIAGRQYEWIAETFLTGATNGVTRLYVEWFTAANAYISSSYGTALGVSGYPVDYANRRANLAKATAPAGAAYARLSFWAGELAGPANVGMSRPKFQESALGTNSPMLFTDDATLEQLGRRDQIGTVYTGTKKPTVGTWLECGQVYLQSSYPALYAELGLLHDYAEVLAQNNGVTFMSTDTVVSGMAFGGGRYVAVASAGSTRICRSEDGRVWQACTLPAEVAGSAWNAVTYGGGYFVAVGDGHLGVYSADGITWTSFNLQTSAAWVSVTFGNGRFVAISRNTDAGSTAVVANMQAWSKTSLPVGVQWSAVAYGNGIFVAVARTATVCATSPDGITWTARALPAHMQFEWNSMAFGAGVFVVVRDWNSGNNAIQSAWSADGITWTTTQLSTTSYAWRAIVWVVDKFIVFGQTNTSGAFATSSTGKSWTLTGGGTVYISGYVPVTSVAANGMISMISASASASATHIGQSITAWEAVRVPLSAYPTWADIFFIEGRFFVTSMTQAVYLTSTDGVTWFARAWNAAYLTMAFGDGKYVAMASTGHTSVSIDGLNWTVGPTIASFGSVSVTYGAGKFVAVQSGGTSSIAYSTDLATWTVVNVGSNLGFVGITFGAGRFAIACTQNSYWISTDGIAWNSMRSPGGPMSFIGFMGGRFVAMSGSSTRAAVATSSDGIAWETAVMPLAGLWGSVSYGEGLFFASVTTGGATIAVSTDCKSWAMKTPDAFSGTAKSAYGTGRFVGMPVGANGNYFALLYASYSRTTQFYVPRAFAEVQGVKQWMKAT